MAFAELYQHGVFYKAHRESRYVLGRGPLKNPIYRSKPYQSVSYVLRVNFEKHAAVYIAAR